MIPNGNGMHYVQALPVRELRRPLLWMCYDEEKPHNNQFRANSCRRFGDSKLSSSTATPVLFPSWTWLGCLVRGHYCYPFDVETDSFAPNSDIFIGEQDNDFAYGNVIPTTDRKAISRFAETACSLRLSTFVSSFNETQFTATSVKNAGDYNHSHVPLSRAGSGVRRRAKHLSSLVPLCSRSTTWATGYQAASGAWFTNGLSRRRSIQS
jgi:hypothetical protein